MSATGRLCYGAAVAVLTLAAAHASAFAQPSRSRARFEIVVPTELQKAGPHWTRDTSGK